MQVFYFDEVEGLPEGAKPFDRDLVLGLDRDVSIVGPFVFVNPKGEQVLEGVSANHHWVELHSDHHFCEVNSRPWFETAPDKMTGIISGFGVEAGLKIAEQSQFELEKMPEIDLSGSMVFINGPNLNLLGTREPHLYGSTSLKDIFELVGKKLPNLNANAMQSNHEGQIIDSIQGVREDTDAIVINAAAYTHTSVAIHDALKAYQDIIIELHITNPHQRDEFRHKSLIAPASEGLIAGFGGKGYVLAALGALLKL